MKKIFFLALVISVILSCKNDKKSETNQNARDSSNKTEKQNDELVLIKGEFVFYEDAAVLQTNNDIYGVYINDKMLELNTLAKQHQIEPTDMVNVEIKGKISNKKDDKILWENKVEIIEIINVTQQAKENNNTIQL